MDFKITSILFVGSKNGKKDKTGRCLCFFVFSLSWCLLLFLSIGSQADRQKAGPIYPTQLLDGLLFSSNIKIRSAMANEIRKEPPRCWMRHFFRVTSNTRIRKGNVHIYFPIVTAIVLSVLIRLLASGGK